MTLPDNSTNRNDDSSCESLENLKLINVPKVDYWYNFNRKENEQQIIKGVGNISEDPSKGIFMICGAGGIGKSTMLASLFRKKTIAEKLYHTNNIDIVLWINCYHLTKGVRTGDDTLKQAFTRSLLDLGMSATDNPDKWMSLQDCTSYFNAKKQRILFVLDDVYHAWLLKYFRSYFPDEMCLAITRYADDVLSDEQKSSLLQTFSKEDVVTNPCKLSKVSNAEIFGMLKAVAGEQNDLSDSHLKKLAVVCAGLASVATLIAASQHLQEVDLLLNHIGIEQIPNLQRRDETTMEEVLQSTLRTLPDGLRNLLNVFIFFSPFESLALSDLSFLWNTINENASPKTIVNFKYKDTQSILELFQEKGLCQFIGRESYAEWDILEIFWDDFFAINPLLHSILVSQYKEITGFDDLTKIRQIEFSKLAFRLLEDGGSDLTDERILVILTKFIEHQKFDLGVKILSVFSGQCICDEDISLAEQAALPKSPSVYPIQDDRDCTVMMMLAKAGLLGMMRHLHRSWPSISHFKVQNQKGQTALMLAVDNGHYAVAKFLLEQDNSVTAKQDLKGWTALVYAVFHGNLELVKYLHEQDGSNIKRCINGGHTPLGVAVMNGRVDVVKYLCEQNVAGILEGNSVDNTVLMVAANYGEYEIFKYLHKKDSRAILVEDKYGWNVLMAAARNGCLDIVKYANEQNSGLILKQNKNGDTALMWAAYNGHLDVVSYLLDAGSISIIEMKNNDNETALLMAAYKDHLNVVEHLGERSQVDAFSLRNKDGWTALMFASRNGNLDMLKYLHEKDESVILKRTTDKDTALMIATRHGHVDVVKFLHEHAQSMISKENSNGETALMFAARHSSLEIVKYLVEQERDTVLKQNDDGDTALMMAVQKGCHVDIIRYLKEQAPSTISVQNDDGWTPLMMAACKGNLEIVRLLVDSDEELVLSRNSVGDTALLLAASNGRCDVVKFLAEKNASVIAQRNVAGDTALIMAAASGQLDVVKYICERDQGAVSKQNRDGDTAVAIAAGYGFLDVVKFLNEQDPAVALIKNNAGKTASQKAAENAHVKVTNYFQEHSVKPSKNM